MFLFLDKKRTFPVRDGEGRVGWKGRPPRHGVHHQGPAEGQQTRHGGQLQGLARGHQLRAKPLEGEEGMESGEQLGEWAGEEALERHMQGQAQLDRHGAGAHGGSAHDAANVQGKAKGN